MKILSFTKILQLNIFHFVDMKFLRVIWLKIFHFVNTKIFQNIPIKLFPLCRQDVLSYQRNANFQGYGHEIWANFPVKLVPIRWKNILLVFLEKHFHFLDMKYSRVSHQRFSTSWTCNFISSPVKLFHFVDMKYSRVPQQKFSTSWTWNIAEFSI